MNTRVLIILAAVVLFGGLYLWDRDNSTVETIGATVLKIEDKDNEAGPDSWHVNVVTAEGETVELSELEKRPEFAQGDSICVDKITRDGFPTEYRRADTGSAC